MASLRLNKTTDARRDTPTLLSLIRTLLFFVLCIFGETKGNFNCYETAHVGYSRGGKKALAEMRAVLYISVKRSENTAQTEPGQASIGDS